MHQGRKARTKNASVPLGAVNLKKKALKWFERGVERIQIFTKFKVSGSVVQLVSGSRYEASGYPSRYQSKYYTILEYLDSDP